MAALWPGQAVPRTPSRTADWLEVAVGRFEAWKASAARSGARRALEFVKAWYPGLNLDQLATWRQQADTELEPARPAIIPRASAIADYTNTSTNLRSPNHAKATAIAIGDIHSRKLMHIVINTLKDIATSHPYSGGMNVPEIQNLITDTDQQ